MGNRLAGFYHFVGNNTEVGCNYREPAWVAEVGYNTLVAAGCRLGRFAWLVFGKDTLAEVGCVGCNWHTRVEVGETQLEVVGRHRVHEQSQLLGIQAETIINI